MTLFSCRLPCAASRHRHRQTFQHSSFNAPTATKIPGGDPIGPPTSLVRTVQALRTLESYTVARPDPVREARSMCRNIRSLQNLAPAATPEEIHAAAVQFVRKVTGSAKPSQANAAAAEHAVAQIAHITTELLDGWVTPTAPRTRDEEAARARARWERRVARA